MYTCILQNFIFLSSFTSDILVQTKTFRTHRMLFRLWNYLELIITFILKSSCFYCIKKSNIYINLNFVAFTIMFEINTVEIRIFPNNKGNKLTYTYGVLFLFFDRIISSSSEPFSERWFTSKFMYHFQIKCIRICKKSHIPFSA